MNENRKEETVEINYNGFIYIISDSEWKEYCDGHRTLKEMFG